MTGRQITARFNSCCGHCGQQIKIGDQIWYVRGCPGQHIACHEKPEEHPAAPDAAECPECGFTSKSYAKIGSNCPRCECECMESCAERRAEEMFLASFEPEREPEEDEA